MGLQVINTENGQVKGVFVNAFNLLITGECKLNNMSNMIKCKHKDGLTLIGSKIGFNPKHLEESIDDLIEKRLNWILSVNIPSKLPELSRRTLYKAFSQIKTQIYTPEGMIKNRWTTPDRWPHRQMWLWDSAFHAIGLRHIDVMLAQETINAVFDIQKENGFVPLCASPQGSSNITQPPVLALAVKLVFEKFPDIGWLKKIYPKLKAYILWDIENRDEDGEGLLEWKIEHRINCSSGESGMDNSPRFDSATRLDAVDFNSFLALECEIMSAFAKMLNLNSESKLWKFRHKNLCSLINERFWNESNRFYLDFDLNLNRHSEVIASSGLLTLICGAPSQRQASKLLEHLDNPQSFNTLLPVPSISKLCEKYYSKDMWRGPVWVNINWVIAFGLRRYGYEAKANSIIHKTLEEQEKMYQKYGTFFEFYDDRGEVAPPHLLRKYVPDSSAQHVNRAFFDYGWSATLYVDMIFEKYLKSEKFNMKDRISDFRKPKHVKRNVPISGSLNC